MTTRDIFILALRVIGFWTLLSAVSGLTYALVMTYQLFGVSSGKGFLPPEYGLIDVLLVAWLPISIQCIAACICFRYATNIASLFYGQAECAEETPPVISVTEAGMYRVAAQLLGVYALLAAIPPLSRSIARFAAGVPVPFEVTAPVQACLYLTSAVLLICGAPSIARWLGKLRYDPETADPDKYHVPEQREG